MTWASGGATDNISTTARARNIWTCLAASACSPSGATILPLRDALKSVLDAELPNLVQMDVSPLAGLLAERLLAHTPYMDKAFFANSGTEAVEAAIKFARAATGRPAIVYCDHAFHGLTYGALSMNGDAIFRKGFERLLTDCREFPSMISPHSNKHSQARCRRVYRRADPRQGRQHARRRLSAEASALCRRYGTLFIADEIQTGLGRTGRFLRSSIGASSPTWC